MNKRFIDVLNDIDSTPLTSGSIVRSIRKNYNISQKELSNLTGILDSNISKIENDKIEIGVQTAMKLAAALGIHPQTILFPNGEFTKNAEIKKIEKKSKKLLEEKMA